MTFGEMVKNNLGLKGLSLLLAVILWLFVTAGQEREISFQAPVLLRNVPPGLVASGDLPAAVDVRVRGSKVLLAKIRAKRPVLSLDLRGATAGKTEFPNVAAMLALPDGVVITRLSPAAVTVRLITRDGTAEGK